MSIQNSLSFPLILHPSNKWNMLFDVHLSFLNYYYFFLLYSIVLVYMEFSSTLRGCLDRGGVCRRTDTCMCMAKSLCCPPESITAMLISYMLIKNKKLNNKILKKERNWRNNSRGGDLPRVTHLSMGRVEAHSDFLTWICKRGNMVLVTQKFPASSLRVKHIDQSPCPSCYTDVFTAWLFVFKL